MYTRRMNGARPVDLDRDPENVSPFHWVLTTEDIATPQYRQVEHREIDLDAEHGFVDHGDWKETVHVYKTVITQEYIGTEHTGGGAVVAHGPEEVISHLQYKGRWRCKTSGHITGRLWGPTRKGTIPAWKVVAQFAGLPFCAYSRCRYKDGDNTNLNPDNLDIYSPKESK